MSERKLSARLLEGDRSTTNEQRQAELDRKDRFLHLSGKLVLQFRRHWERRHGSIPSRSDRLRVRGIGSDH